MIICPVPVGLRKLNRSFVDKNLSFSLGVTFCGYNLSIRFSGIQDDIHKSFCYASKMQLMFDFIIMYFAFDILFMFVFS